MQLHTYVKLGKCKDKEKEKADVEEGLARPKISAKARTLLQDQLTKLEQQCELYEDCLIIPVNRLPLRGALFDVVLRETPLRAVHAMHTILSRMLMFECSWCRESFPIFHTAFQHTGII